MQSKSLMALANEKSYDALEAAWIDALDALPTGIEDLLRVIEWLVKAKEQERAAVLAATLLEALEEHKQWDGELALCERLLRILPANADVRMAYGHALCALHADNPAMPGIVARSRLNEGAPLDECRAEIKRRMGIRKGMFALHRGRRMAVHVEEFEAKADVVRLSDGTTVYGASLSTYLDQYEPLDENDFRVMQSFNRDKLIELAESDPERIVVSYLKYSGKQSTFRDFRETLSSCAVAPEDWKTWWARVKKQLVNNPFVDLGDGTQPSLSLRDSPRDFSEHVLREFDFAEHRRAKGAMALRYLHEVKAGAPLNETIISHFFAQLGAIATAGEPDPFAFAAWLALETVGRELKRDAPAFRPAWVSTPEACAVFAHWCSWEPTYVAPCIKLLPEAYPDWPVVFGRLIPFAPLPMIDQLVAALVKAGRVGDVQSAVNLLEVPSAPCVEAYAWMWRAIATEEQIGLAFPIDLKTATMGIFKLIRQLSSAQDTEEQNVHEALASLRHTVASRKYEVVKAVFQKLGPDQAQALYQAIAGNTGLSTPMRSQLVHILSRSCGIGGKA